MDDSLSNRANTMADFTKGQKDFIHLKISKELKEEPEKAATNS